MRRVLTRLAASAAVALALAGALAFAVMTVRQGRHFDRAFDEMVNGLRVTVFDLNGNVVSDTVAGTGGDHSRREEFMEALSTGTGTAVRKSASTGAHTIYSARQIGPHILRCGIPFNRLKRLQSADRRGDLTAALAVLFALVFAFVLVFRMNRRVVMLAAERDAGRRRAEEAERMARFRRDFVADFSHELRTPLTGIVGAAELLGGSGAAELPEASRRRLAETIRCQSRRLEELSGEVLQLAELDTVAPGGAPRGAADIAGVVAKVVESLRAESGEGSARIVVGPMPRAAAAMPALYVERIVGNLLANAVKHASARTITVSLAVDGASAELAVADDGVGIGADDLKRVFERFYRVDKSRGVVVGTGLGLAIVKHTAEAFGGSARAESVPGEGSVFRVEFPLCADAREMSGDGNLV
jgi:signal transduction histidine kinase